MTKLDTTFTSPNGNATLRIVAHEGKKGFNLHVANKTKGDEKAVVGCRNTFDTEDEAKAAYDALVASATERGWTSGKAKTVRNAFTEIPMAPTEAVEVVEVVKVKKSKKAA